MKNVVDRQRDRLVEKGKALFNSSTGKHTFTKNIQANDLLNDLLHNPHAFVIACLMDRRVNAEMAWEVPFRLSERLGNFSMTHLLTLTPNDLTVAMRNPTPLHRYVDIMSDNLYLAIQRIGDQYDGDASRIWSGKLSSAEVVYRFLQFKGIGPKIASMATNILTRHLNVSFADYFSIDISADVHVRRVFARLGWCDESASVEQVIYKARAIYPEFPGIMDLPCWEIGRMWCRPREPVCGECFMNDICPKN